MEDIFAIYTDGSCNNMKEPNYGGWAYIILEGDSIIEQDSGGEIHTTNNRMEMTAIINSLKNIPVGSNITFFTDSKYSIGAFERSKLTPETKNVDLINIFHSIVEDRMINVSFTWVRGHNGNKYNEMVDSIANNEYSKISGEELPDFNSINKRINEAKFNKQSQLFNHEILYSTR